MSPSGCSRPPSWAGVGLVSIVLALYLNDIRWTPEHIVAMTLVSSTAISSATFVWAAGFQFFVIDGAELTNSFVYGGRYAATQVASVWSRPIKVAFGFVVPMAFAGFLPALLLLGKSRPYGCPPGSAGGHRSRPSQRGQTPCCSGGPACATSQGGGE